MESYAALVRHRLEERHANLFAKLDELPEPSLRFTVRLFGDCLDEEARRRLLGGYSEYGTDAEIRAFLGEFLPAYLEYALAELAEKKKDGDRFHPPFLTQEEYQEMTVREKWPRIGAHAAAMTPLQLRREIARTGLLFRPYMLSDPGFNEGVLEFALYFDLLDRLEKLSSEELRAAAGKIAGLVERAVAAKSPEEALSILQEIRTRAARAAGIEADPETLIGPPLERYPREGPPGWKMRELRATLKTMSLKDLRLSALVHLDLLTAEETREIVAPFIGRYPSFYEIPSKGLAELILAIAERTPDRALTFFFERYATGRMAMTPPVSYLVWKLMPEEERLLRLREDNAAMDQTMMARHMARYLLSESPAAPGDPGRQIALLTDPAYARSHGALLQRAGGPADPEGLKRLYDEVTILSLRMMTRPEGEEREAIYRAIRERIAAAAGPPPTTTEGGT